MARIESKRIVLERTATDWGFWFRRKRTEQRGYSTTYGHVWNRDDTGYRAGLGRELWLNREYDAWRHRRVVEARS